MLPGGNGAEPAAAAAAAAATATATASGIGGKLRVSTILDPGNVRRPPPVGTRTWTPRVSQLSIDHP